ncbi:MAG: carboxypeptidase regulatory-like domain-containing protein, partial [Acidobacteriia bacterium]|nr:carboxypeptidase regulatory-like domain-containing protein [Terriglobia bacterium]
MAESLGFAGTTVTISVFDVDKLPVSAAAIQATQGTRIRVSTTTTDTGTASLELEPGHYIITVTKDGFDRAQSEVDAKVSEPASIEITLAPSVRQ